MNKRVLFLAVALAAMTSCKTKQEPSTTIEKSAIEVINGEFTPEIMHKLGKVSDVQISPSGEKVMYGVTYTDIALNKGQRHLYLMDIDGSDNRQLTHFDKSVNNARWIDDSNIAFLMGGQLHIWNIKNGGAPAKISNVEGGMEGFEFSPDFSKVMYIARVQSAIKPTDDYPDLDKSSGRTINNLMYRHWDCFVETIPHTFISSFSISSANHSIGEGVDILDGAPYELPTLPFGGLEQLSWSPDGKHLAYSCRKVTGKEYAYSTNTDIYIYDIESKECENISKGMMGYDTDPLYSPDGKYIAWISMERAGFEADKQRLFVMDLSTRQRKELTTNYKYNVSSISWKSDGSGLYFASLVNALQGLFEISLDGEVKRITPDDLWFDFDGGTVVGDKIITTNRCMNRPNEIVAVSLKDGSFEQLTHENDDILRKVKSGKIEQRWITTVDKKKMHTWVVYPPDFDPNKKYPAILFCLGGPQGTISQGWSTRWNYKLMASKGYIVILPNRRGTTAFGQEWCDQISGDYCGLNMQDYLISVKEMQKEPYVGKVAAVGASYGGYSIYYLAGIHNNTFSAFISHAGIFNQEQMYMMTEEMWFPHWDNGGAPWDNNPVAKRHYANSPHKLIKNWNTPILITHGEMDYRVPVEQGMAAFNAAQMMGVPSKMLLFPEENHWILKPQNSIHWNRVFFDWLDQWCK